MTTELPLAWMKQSFKNHGLDVKGTEGWKHRGRPYTFTPKGVVFHHTASSIEGGVHPAMGTVTVGRDGIPGPLCNVLVGRDAVLYLIAAGYANHAGLGGPFKDVPLNSGNRYFVGFEFENNGVGEPWKPKMLEVGAHAMAICLRHFDQGAGWCIGHKEWTPRKIDPFGVDMDNFRHRVKVILDHMN